MLGLTLVSGRRHCGFYMCAGSNGVRSGMPKLTIWIICIPHHFHSLCSHVGSTILLVGRGRLLHQALYHFKTKAVRRFRGESPQSFIFCYFLIKKPLICVQNYKSFRIKKIMFFSRN